MDFIIMPFAWLLKTLYEFTGNYGVAIILFALVIKVILLYFSARGKKGMLQTQRLQPKIQALQKQHANDKVQAQQAVQKLYQDEGVSMTGGCLWTLLPFPILIALYGVIQRPLTHIMGLAQAGVDQVTEAVGNVVGDVMPAVNEPYYQLKLSDLVHQQVDKLQDLFASLPGLVDINYNFLGLNLAETPQFALQPLILIPLLSGATSYLAMWLTTKFNQRMGIAMPQNKLMNLMGPALSLYFAFLMPALMGLYWTAQNLLGIVQDYFLTRHFQKVFAAEDARKAELETRRKAAEEAMKEEQRQRRAEAIEAKKQKRKPGQTVYKMQNKPKKKDDTD